MQGYTCLRRQHDLHREFEPCIGLKLATSRHLYTFIDHKGLPFLESPQVASYFEPGSRVSAKEAKENLCTHPVEHSQLQTCHAY